MSGRFPAGDRLLEEAVGKLFPAACLYIGRGEKTLYRRAIGWMEPEDGCDPVRLDTRFDLASLTKLVTATTFLRLVAAGRVALDDRVATVLPAFTGRRPIRPYEDPLIEGNFITVDGVEEGAEAEAGEVTFRHLLTHTSGLPAWHPLFRLPREAIREAVLQSFFAYPVGATLVYSDLGFILLGWAVEVLSGLPLDQAIATHLLAPLALVDLSFGPFSNGRVAPTEHCGWRERRLRGEVHDENAGALGGVAGHAGLFGTVDDLASFGRAWLAALAGSDGAILPPALAREAVTVQVATGEVRRGLGWLLWQRAAPFSLPGDQTVGHTGFTGTSLLLDPDRELVAVCLTNHVYYGRAALNRMRQFRVAFHRALMEWVAR